MKKAREGSKEALKTSPRPGRPPKRSEEQRSEELPSLLEKGPEHFGFRGEVWTRKRVRKVIKEEFGAQVRRLSGRLDLGSDRVEPPKTRPPLRQTRRGGHRRVERAGVAANQKKRESKKAETNGRTVMFVDEAGFYQLPAAVRTRAPCGETPVLRAPLNCDNLSAISGITQAGKLYMRAVEQSISGEEVA